LGWLLESGCFTARVILAVTFTAVQTPAEMPAPGAALIADFWISTLP